jgi:hypothetical protein
LDAFNRMPIPEAFKVKIPVDKTAQAGEMAKNG